MRIAQVLGKVTLNRCHPSFRNASLKLVAPLDIQDLASQAVGLVCAAAEGQSWWDVCAGAGGKSLQLADRMGRTGRILAHEHWDVLPDVVTLAKGLAGGFPIGAILARGEAARTLTRGSHASTFGGTPLATSAAAAVVSELRKDPFLEGVRETGGYMLERLSGLAGSLPA